MHPGYGFLSENADFVDACNQAGIAFVGPPAAAMRAMGVKDRAKTLMEKAGVPVVPGYHGERQDAKFLKEKAYEIGYPVLIKPAAGGGGRGLRRVDKHAEFEAALEGAIREAESAFGSSRVLLEKYVAAPRHIEIQVFADGHGNVIHLGERDCSLQRRHQKVIEEAPAPGMTPELRAQMGAAAVEAARAVGYVGAGTVEFIADGTKGLRADAFWFIEMNTRLQVEHPVTEAVTALDLVEWQFRVACGEKLPLEQSQVRFDGHAIEARVYAEDPESGFLPSTGRIVALELPADIRVDSGVEAGGEVTPYYDAMIAKLIAHAPTREAALDRLAAALDRTVIAGPRSNVAFLAALTRASEFRQGKVDTGFIDRNLAALGAVPRKADFAAAALGVANLLASIKPEANFRMATHRLMSQPKQARRGRRATAFNSAERARTPCLSRSMARARSRRSAMAQTACALRSREPRRQPTRGCSRPTTRLMSCVTAARPACASRILPPRLRRPVPATASSRRRCMAGCWRSTSRSAIAWPPANVLP